MDADASNRLRIHILDVINGQNLILSRPVQDRVITRRALPLAWQCRPELPETVICDLRILHHSCLPLMLHRCGVRALRAIFLQHDRLACLSANGIMLFDPRVSPTTVITH